MIGFGVRGFLRAFFLPGAGRVSGPPARICGAMYAGVPAACPEAGWTSSSLSARPKSHTTGSRPSRVIGICAESCSGAELSGSRESSPPLGLESPLWLALPSRSDPAWPTIYVIDDQGVIRQNDLRGDTLDAPLERLVEATEAKAAAKR